jgi:ribosomal protein S18 acetylase RimI-like enzyme
MQELRIEQQDNLPEGIEKRIHQGHVHDEAALGIVCNYRRFFIVAQDPDGEFLGALAAYTAFAEIYVDDIWVDPANRKRDIGKKLLEDLAHRYQDKGFNNINLVTSEFQAPSFYKKCGFELEFVRVNKHNPELTKYFFVKYFDNKNQTQGLITK